MSIEESKDEGLQKASQGPPRLQIARLPAVRDQTLDSILQAMPDWKASDLHLQPNNSMVRIAGELRPIEKQWDDAAIRHAVAALLRPEQREYLDHHRSVDFAVVNGMFRFRGTAFEHQEGLSAVFRLIPSVPPSIDELRITDESRAVLHRLTDVKRGLILIGGSTGSGKSTTLAAMIGELARRPVHIVTLENPPEFDLTKSRDMLGLIQQLEIGNHVESFARGIHNCLRQDPDVIVVGELRDIPETDAALKAAETGHLVLATIHTQGVVSALDRLTQMYPGDEQPRVRIQLSQTLKGVVFQHLVHLQANPEERMAACEIMLAHPGISNLIRTGKPEQIPGAIQAQRGAGMILLDDALSELALKRIITPEVAIASANDQDQMRRKVGGFLRVA